MEKNQTNKIPTFCFIDKCLEEISEQEESQETQEDKMVWCEKCQSYPTRVNDGVCGHCGREVA